jgi:hypothetical protein
LSAAVDALARVASEARDLDNAASDLEAAFVRGLAVGQPPPRDAVAEWSLLVSLARGDVDVKLADAIVPRDFGDEDWRALASAFVSCIVLGREPPWRWSARLFIREGNYPRARACVRIKDHEPTIGTYAAARRVRAAGQRRRALAAADLAAALLRLPVTDENAIVNLLERSASELLGAA